MMIYVPDLSVACNMQVQLILDGRQEKRRAETMSRSRKQKNEQSYTRVYV